MNRLSYDQADVAVAAEVLNRWYGCEDVNHSIAAVVLDTVMNARHNRNADLPFWKRLILALAR